MLYILDITTELPKLNFTYKDGDYLKYLKNQFDPNDLNILMDTIVDYRKDMLFYKRTFTNSECTTTYIFKDEISRRSILNFVKEFYSDKNIPQKYAVSNFDMSVKEYIFLR